MSFWPTSRRTRSLALCAAIALAVPVFAGPAQRAMAAAGPATFTGSLPDGATYLIQVPDSWNGTLVLYSHGIVIPGNPNPARDAGDPLTGQYLLARGYALAGSSYASTGWAVQDGLADQIATLDVFAGLVGRPTRTIAWGHSLGGLITAGLLQRYPDRFAGALPMCGPLAGSVATWNQALDAEFVFQQLMAPPGPLQLVHITDPAQNLQIAEQPWPPRRPPRPGAPASPSRPPSPTCPGGSHRAVPSQPPPTTTPRRATSSSGKPSSASHPRSPGGLTWKPGPGATRRGTAA
jgi:pimeloyl-ACP methyl ester carboxylesterase